MEAKDKAVGLEINITETGDDWGNNFAQPILKAPIDSLVKEFPLTARRRVSKLRDFTSQMRK